MKRTKVKGQTQGLLPRLRVHYDTTSFQCSSTVLFFFFKFSVCKWRCDKLPNQSSALILLDNVTFCPSVCTPAVCALQGIMGPCMLQDPLIAGDGAFKKTNGRLVFPTLGTQFLPFRLYKSESGPGVFLPHPWKCPLHTSLAAAQHMLFTYFHTNIPPLFLLIVSAKLIPTGTEGTFRLCWAFSAWFHPIASIAFTVFYCRF